MISFILSGLLHSWHFAWPGGIMTQGQECSCWGFSSKLGRLFLGSPSGESWLAFSGDRLFTEQARYLIMVLAPWWFAGNCNQRGGLVKSLIQPVQVIFCLRGRGELKGAAVVRKTNIQLKLMRQLPLPMPKLLQRPRCSLTRSTRPSQGVRSFPFPS